MSCIQSGGIYYLTNVKGGTAIDLSGGDNYTVTGYNLHKGPNQSWIFQASGGDREFYLKSVGTAQYLAPEGAPGEGQKVVAKGSPFAWRVEDEPGRDSVVRLLAPGTPFCADLSNYGSSDEGTDIKLYGRWDAENQLWKLQKAQ